MGVELLPHSTLHSPLSTLSLFASDDHVDGDANVAARSEVAAHPEADCVTREMGRRNFVKRHENLMIIQEVRSTGCLGRMQTGTWERPKFLNVLDPEYLNVESI